MQPLPASATLPSAKCTSDYPGESAHPHEIQRLADEYRRAAVLLHDHCHQRRSPLSWAPCRQIAIHAIELYLNALLLNANHTSNCVRGFQHDLGPRIEAAATIGLKLKKRTESHLRDLSSSREYLIVRYGPEMISNLSPINRVMATLDEIATKVAKLIAKLPQTRPGTDAPKIAGGFGKLSSPVEIDEKNGPLRIRPLPNASRKTSR